MWFNIVTNNHGSPYEAGLNLHKTIKYVHDALCVSGHDVTIEHEMLYPEAVNIYFEHFFNDDFYRQIIRTKRAYSLRMGMITTELVTGSTIPYARYGIRAGEEATKAEYIAKRVAGQEAAARDMDFVWSLLERTAIECRKFTANSEFFPVGHVQSVPPHLCRSPKNIDVCFFGASTPHRAKIIDSLTARGLHVVAAGAGFQQGYLPENWLNSLLDRSKIGLNLTLHSYDKNIDKIDPRFVSCMRVVEMLNRGVCVVSEHIPLDNPYGPYMLSAAPEQLAEMCSRLIADGSWREKGAAAAAGFRTAMEAGKICGPVIDRTLGRLPC